MRSWEIRDCLPEALWMPVNARAPLTVPIMSMTRKWRDDGRGRTGNVQRVMLPGWLVMLIIVVIAVVVIGLVSSLLYIFAPVIIAGLIVTLVVRLIRDKK